jgi:hypothetical protein
VLVLCLTSKIVLHHHHLMTKVTQLLVKKSVLTTNIVMKVKDLDAGKPVVNLMVVYGAAKMETLQNLVATLIQVGDVIACKLLML